MDKNKTKYICIKDTGGRFFKIGELRFFKIGEFYTIKNLENNIDTDFLEEHFLPINKFREIQINKILNQ